MTPEFENHCRTSASACICMIIGAPHERLCGRDCTRTACEQAAMPGRLPALPPPAAVAPCEQPPSLYRISARTRHGGWQQLRQLVLRHRLAHVVVLPQAARRRHLLPKGSGLEVAHVARDTGVAGLGARAGGLMRVCGGGVSHVCPSACVRTRVCMGACSGSCLGRRAMHTPSIACSGSAEKPLSAHLDAALVERPGEVVVVNQVPAARAGRPRGARSRAILVPGSEQAPALPEREACTMGGPGLLADAGASLPPSLGSVERRPQPPAACALCSAPRRATHMAFPGPMTTGMGWRLSQSSSTSGPFLAFFLALSIFTCTWRGRGRVA